MDYDIQNEGIKLEDHSTRDQDQVTRPHPDMVYLYSYNEIHIWFEL